jgi:two-component system, NtrC family, response regulator GlrR
VKPDRELERQTEDARRLSSKVLVQRFRLRVKEGLDAGLSRLSEGKTVVVGSHESADLVLRDRTVSRFHCEISIVDGKPEIRDLGSRNGTWVNGVPVLHAPLLDEAWIAVGHTRLRFDLREQSAEVELSARTAFGSLVGRSPAMRAVFALLERAAASDSTVLLEGATGTGKGAAAEAIHASSARAEGPFVVVDCGALPPQLAPSELFGHRRGAFTGASESRVGALEAAHGGTVFLDEIGELPLDLQPQLLRAIDQRQVKRIGDAAYHPIDVRVIAATHRDLRTEVNERRFRSDLFYRLAVLTIRMPTLAERLEDLPLLCERLLEGIPGAAGRPDEPPRSEAFVAHLARHSWPGNVRELRNYLERCCVLNAAEPPSLQGSSDELRIDPGQSFRAARERWQSEFERRYLRALLEGHGGNIRAAAQAAELDRTYLYRLLWRHGIR